jgi:murein DD-endopeptidase MepM/ murein hydrolase activator NlpD
MLEMMERSKIKRNVLSIFLSAVLILSGSFGCGFASLATESTQTEESTSTEAAETTTDTTASSDGGTADASISKAKEDAAEAERNKNAAQEILDNLKAAKENIEDYIVELDKSVNELQIEISHLEQSQKELEESIADTKKKLSIAKKAQDSQYDDMKQRIQMVYESGNKRYLDVLLTATSMTDMLNKTEYISQVSLYDYNILKELKSAREQVANLKQKLDKDLESNEAMQKEVNDQKETMETLVEEKSKQLSEYETTIAGQQAEVDKYAKAQAEAEAIIAAAEQAASSSATSTYTGGVFTWPAPGNYTITSYFGNRTSPTAGASTNHKGLDIACSTGDSIVAAASGTVIVATYNYAEGNYICIDHGGGVVTVYMHNSQLNVSVGETVTAGQTIAAAGSTGYSTGPHCHFGVRVDGTYVDPLGYLQ